VRPTLVWRTLESMVAAVAMDSRVKRFPRVRGGSYTGSLCIHTRHLGQDREVTYPGSWDVETACSIQPKVHFN